MTIASETARQRHSGNGATFTFSTGFLFLANSHVRVILTDEDGIDTEWVENTQYTLTGADTGSNGTVTVVTSPTDYTPATGETLTIIRDVPFTQTLDANALTTLPASSVEDSYDKIWMALGQLKEAISRAYVSSETGAGGAPDLEELTAWSPELAVASDGTRRVLQIVGWIGGAGTEPDSGQYISSSGLVDTAAAAEDIRGPVGAGNGDLLATSNLSDVSNTATAFANIKQAATTSASGVVELATDAEAQTGTDTARAITPANLQAVTATETRKGVVELATTVEAAGGADTARAVTAAGVAAAITALASTFPAGTVMLFVQTAAPTGWTKSVTHNDKALRVVSGAVSSGGTVNFSTFFARTGTDAVTLIEANLPPHTHTEEGVTSRGPYDDGAGAGVGLASIDSGTTGSTGSGTSFTPAIDCRVKCVDVILASKD